jgi:hypothetical protein
MNHDIHIHPSVFGMIQTHRRSRHRRSGGNCKQDVQFAVINRCQMIPFKERAWTWPGAGIMISKRNPFPFIVARSNDVGSCSLRSGKKPPPCWRWLDADHAVWRCQLGGPCALATAPGRVWCMMDDTIQLVAHHHHLVFFFLFFYLLS